MSTAPQVDVRVMATGLGAGILVDATVVRCLLVPALIMRAGRGLHDRAAGSVVLDGHSPRA